MKDGRQHPDIIFTSHVHQIGYAAYEIRNKSAYKLMHAVVTPSWQMKTKYAHMVAPVAKNKIGGVHMLITEAGLVETPRFSILEA